MENDIIDPIRESHDYKRQYSMNPGGQGYPHPISHSVHFFESSKDKFHETSPLLQEDEQEKASGDEISLARQSTLYRKVVKKGKRFVVYDLSDGMKSYKKLDLRIDELIHLVHMYNDKQELQGTIPGALRLRDIRQIVAFSGAMRPSIEARRNCILVNVPYTRCIILHRKVFLIVKGCGNFPLETRLSQEVWGQEPYRMDSMTPIGPAEFIESFDSNDWDTHDEPLQEIDFILLDKFSQLLNITTSTPFEFNVLEAILVENIDMLKTELTRLHRGAEKRVTKLPLRVTSSVATEIVTLKRVLNKLQEKVRGLLTAINELMISEDNLGKLLVSRRWEYPDEWPSHMELNQKEDLEMLLECYSQEVDSIHKRVIALDEVFDNTLRALNIHLGTSRNALLKLEVALTLITGIVSIGALVTGIFGMNLQSGYERYHPFLFWTLCGGVLFACSVASLFGYLLVKRMDL